MIVMRRYADSTRLASLVTNGQPVQAHLRGIAQTLARFHGDATRSPKIDAHATVGAIVARWQQNLAELQKCADGAISAESVQEVRRLATQFIAGRAELFASASRTAASSTGTLTCWPTTSSVRPRDWPYWTVWSSTTTCVTSMLLMTRPSSRWTSSSWGGRISAASFLDEYSRHADDPAPAALKDFYIAYRAVVRAKVDCVRMSRVIGRGQRCASAHRHRARASEGRHRPTHHRWRWSRDRKDDLSRALAEQVGAQVISTDDVRRQLQQAGAITGLAGDLDAGLYTPAKCRAVYDEVLRRARRSLSHGSSVILDGTWRDARQRERARSLGEQTATPIVEFSCSVPLKEASRRIQGRSGTNSDATPQIAAAMAKGSGTSSMHTLSIPADRWPIP